jgi:hypothetical protein
MIRVDAVISILTALIIFMFCMLGTLGVWDSHWFTLGYNENLTFFHTVIDEPIKYSFLIIFIILLFVLKSIGEFWVEPWLRATTRGGLLYTPYTDSWMNFMLTMWEIFKWVSLLITIQIAMTQLDIWLICATIQIAVQLVLRTYWEERSYEGFTPAELIDLKKLLKNNKL